MRLPLLTAVLVASMVAGSAAVAAEPGRFTARVVTTGLADPYEITWGPDGFIWATEKSGLRDSPHGSLLIGDPR